MSTLNDDILNELKELRKELQCLVEINARLAKEVVELKNNTESVPKITTQVQSGIVIDKLDDKKLKVVGNTYKHRSFFNTLGGVWNSEQKHWELEFVHKETLIEKFIEDNIDYKNKIN